MSVLIIIIVGLFMFLTGVLFSYGSFLTIVAKQLQTVALIGIPLFHLLSGIGILAQKPWARLIAFYLCCFYMLLGVFALERELLLIDFLPCVAFIPYLPDQVLLLPKIPLIAGFLFALPVFIILCLSLKGVAVRFEPVLGRNYSWNAPFSVILATGFIFSYAFLDASKIEFFTSVEPRTIFGFRFEGSQSLILNYLQFYFPLALSLGLAWGGALFFLSGLGWAVYSIYHLWFENSAIYGAFNSKLIIFGAGWFFSGIVLLFHSGFFLSAFAWRDARSENKFAKFLFVVICFVTIGAVAAVHVQHLTNYKISSIKGVDEIKETRAVKEIVKLGGGLSYSGSSVDPNGSYAIINDQILQKDDQVQGYRIETIERTYVTVSKEGKKYRLDLEGLKEEMLR